MGRAVDIFRRDYISMRDLISDWDGDSDVTQEVMDAVAAYDQVFFPFKPQGYRVSDTITLSRFNQNLYGPQRRGSVFTGSVFLDANASVNTLFNVRAASVKFTNMALRNKGRLVADTVLIDATGSSTANLADVDFTLDGCAVGDSRTVLRIRGRGMNIFDCNIVLSYDPIQIDWIPIDDFVPGSGNDQKLDTGMRIYRIDGCRFHAMSGFWLIQNTGYNAANIRGLQIINNHIDGIGHIFKGELHSSVIANNHLYHAIDTRPMIELTGGSKSSIANNYFGGMTSAEAPARQLKVGAVLSNCSDITFAGNTWWRVQEDVYQLGANCTNIAIVDEKHIDCCLDNDGVTSRSVVNLSSSCTGLSVVGNSHRLTYTPSSWTKAPLVRMAEPTREFLGAAVNTANEPAYNFASQSFGAEDANRVIVVCVHGRAVGAEINVSRLTVGAVEATKVVGATRAADVSPEDFSCAEIWAISLPTGTVGTVRVEFNAESRRCAIQVYRLTNVEVTASDTGSSVVTPPSDTIAVVPNGIVIGAASTAFNGVTSCTWTGLTEDYDALVAENEALTTSSASRVFSAAADTGSVQITAEFTEDFASLAVLAAFEPKFAITRHNIRDNVFDPLLWDATNFTVESVADSIVGDSKIVPYVGTDQASQTIQLPFRPRCVHVSRLGSSPATVVIANDSAAGAAHAVIDGSSVVVKGVFNTEAENYSLYAIV